MSALADGKLDAIDPRDVDVVEVHAEGSSQDRDHPSQDGISRTYIHEHVQNKKEVSLSCKAPSAFPCFRLSEIDPSGVFLP